MNNDSRRTVNPDEAAIHRYMQNCQQIASLLAENESLIRENHWNCGPYLVSFPRGVIRTKQEILKTYPLSEICADPDVRDNIVYSIELQDLLEWMLMTFHLYGAISVTLRKQMLVNSVSIMEAMLAEAAERTGILDPNKKNSWKRTSSRQIASMMKKRHLLPASLADEYISLYQYRNRVHIHASKENEIRGGEFSDELLNQCPQLIRNLADALASAVKDRKFRIRS